MIKPCHVGAMPCLASPRNSPRSGSPYPATPSPLPISSASQSPTKSLPVPSKFYGGPLRPRMLHARALPQPAPRPSCRRPLVTVSENRSRRSQIARPIMPRAPMPNNIHARCHWLDAGLWAPFNGPCIRPSSTSPTSPGPKRQSIHLATYNAARLRCLGASKSHDVCHSL
ncbi:hypothetical protein BS50DRAFT_657298, partial [Corynespora cassiicola Philippines]